MDGAEAGTAIFESMISWLLIFLPYSSALASSSSVTAAPPRSRPPKIPRERE